MVRVDWKSIQGVEGENAMAEILEEKDHAVYANVNQFGTIDLVSSDGDGEFFKWQVKTTPQALVYNHNQDERFCLDEKQLRSYTEDDKKSNTWISFIEWQMRAVWVVHLFEANKEGWWIKGHGAGSDLRFISIDNMTYFARLPLAWHSRISPQKKLVDEAVDP